MLAADRAHTNLPEFMTWGLAWRELYRTAVMAERRADAEIAKRQARQQKLAQMKGGR
jgi:hypothetical protein